MYRRTTTLGQGEGPSRGRPALQVRGAYRGRLPPQVREVGGFTGEDHQLRPGGLIYRGRLPPQVRGRGGGALTCEDHHLISGGEDEGWHTGQDHHFMSEGCFTGVDQHLRLGGRGLTGEDHYFRLWAYRKDRHLSSEEGGLQGRTNTSGHKGGGLTREDHHLRSEEGGSQRRTTRGESPTQVGGGRRGLTGGNYHTMSEGGAFRAGPPSSVQEETTSKDRGKGGGILLGRITSHHFESGRDL